MVKAKLRTIPLALLTISTTTAFTQGGIDDQPLQLEELIVTVQKREESLQDASISVAAMGANQLTNQGLASMTDFQAGAIPTLRISPFPNNPATQVVFIRGVGNSDAEQATKEMGVGIYLDSVYLGRASGMAMELADLERIEVLRGPQGTLYGRNALGGAVNMITQKPGGEFEFDQTFSVGNHDYFKSVTKLDLPQTGAFSGKLAYLTS